MNQSAETPSPVLYPTQYGTMMPGALRTFRDGMLGNRRHSVPYGQSLAPFDNGMFGPALGNVAETPVSLHAYRDGLFNQGIPSQMPGPLTAYRGGLFSSPLGQAAGGLDFSDPAVVLEWTTVMQDYWTTSPPTVATSTWNQAVSDQVLIAGQALLGTVPPGSNLTIDSFLHAGPDGFYYPKVMVMLMGFDAAYDEVCGDGRQGCPFPILRDYRERCIPAIDAIEERLESENGSIDPNDLAAGVAMVDSACPILYPVAPAPTATASMAGANSLAIGGLVALVLLGGGVAVYATRKR